MADAPGVAAWLAEQGIAADDGDVLLRRTLDAQGRSRAWINGRPATLAQLKDIGERLVDLHGQHAHQSLAAPEAQRSLVDAFGGFTALAARGGASWRAWKRPSRSATPRPARRRRPPRSATSSTRADASSRHSASPPTSGRR